MKKKTKMLLYSNLSEMKMQFDLQLGSTGIIIKCVKQKEKYILPKKMFP